MPFRFSTADVEKILASKKKFNNSPKNFAMHKVINIIFLISVKKNSTLSIFCLKLKILEITGSNGFYFSAESNMRFGDVLDFFPTSASL